ncbi:hypothetical protein JOC86_000098 [Bacillus pakistanensis]|uniref:Uncharacterized protein n=2 Tax=Rossellomorea pakistanensis TaxID=992288 RepID=A0ABS2N6T2_9BACI|nr:hypothetical protein [Bacillus pakistanensis]
MEESRQHMTFKTFCILAMCILYIFSFFLPYPFIRIILAIITILVFIYSCYQAKPFFKVISLLMLSAGFCLTIITGKGLEGIQAGIISNVPLLTLIILVPLIAIPLKVGRYLQACHYYIEKFISKPKLLFANLTTFLFLFGPVLNIGTIRLLDDVVQKFTISPKLLAKGYLTGFSTVVLWSPYFASVGLVTHYLHISIVSYFAISIPFAILQLIVANFLFQFTARNQDLQIEQGPIHSITSSHDRKKIWGLLIIVFTLMCSVLFLERLTHWPMLLLVSIISLLFPLGWIIFSKRKRLFAQHLFQFRNQSLLQMDNEIVMFISAGLFGASLTGTDFAETIGNMMNTISSVSFLLFILVTILSFITLTLIGFHPIIFVIPVISQVDPIVIGTTPEVVAIIFMLSWSLSAVISPINPLNILVSSLVKKKSSVVGLKWNGKFVITILLIGILYIYFVQNVLV